MIKGFFANDFLVGCDTSFNNFTNEVNDHAYAVLGAYTVTMDNGTTANLIRYMNPWHTDVWKTNPWADNSSVWTPHVIAQVPFINSSDGISFSTVEDYLSNFAETDWAEIQNGYDVEYVDISLAGSTPNVSTKYQTFFNYTGNSSSPIYITIYGFDGRLLNGCNAPFSQDSLFVADPNRQIFQNTWGTVKIPNPIQGIYTIYAGITQIYTYIDYFTISAYVPIGSFAFNVQDNDNNLYQKKKCPNDCNFQGSCNYLIGTCTCYFGV